MIWAFYLIIFSNEKCLDRHFFKSWIYPLLSKCFKQLRSCQELLVRV